MDRLERAAILIALIEELKKKDSWCGETHIQKATFFLQELMKVPLSFDFILYKHGPFSFDLRDELTALQADLLLKSQMNYPYGPSILPGELSELIKSRYSQLIEKYDDEIKYISNVFCNKDVVELEKISTALYVSLEVNGDSDPDSRSLVINRLKPHISIEEAKEAVKKVDKIINDSKSIAA